MTTLQHSSSFSGPCIPMSMQIGIPFWTGTLVDACSANARCFSELKPEKSWLPGGHVDNSDGQSREFREQVPIIVVAAPTLALVTWLLHGFTGAPDVAEQGALSAAQVARKQVHPLILAWRALAGLGFGYMLYRSEVLLLLMIVSIVFVLGTLIQALRLWLAPSGKLWTTKERRRAENTPPTSCLWFVLLWAGPLAAWTITVLIKLLAESQQRRVGFYWIAGHFGTVLGFFIGKPAASSVVEFCEPWVAVLELDRAATPWYLFYGMMMLRLVSWAVDAHWAVTEQMFPPETARKDLAGGSGDRPEERAGLPSDSPSLPNPTSLTPGSSQHKRRLSRDEEPCGLEGRDPAGFIAAAANSAATHGSSSPPTAPLGDNTAHSAKRAAVAPGVDAATGAALGTAGSAGGDASELEVPRLPCRHGVAGPGYRERVKVSHPLSDYGLALIGESPSILHAAARLGWAWLTLVAYCLYAPTAVAGPISTFNAWQSQCKVPQATYRGWGLVAVCGRALGLIFCLEVAASYVPFFAVTKHGAYEGFGPAAISKLGYTAIIMLWLKFAAIWATMRAWALLDGIETPDNMGRCVSNNFSLVDFWRSWHRSFNIWLVRYVYVPLGGNRVGILRQIVNTALVFLFVALWHDINPELLVWGGLIGLLFVPEFTAKALVAKGGWLSWMRAEWWFRYVVAAAAALNIFMMIVPNVVGYTKLGSRHSIVHMLWMLLITGGDDKEDPGGLPLLAGIFVLLGVAALLMLWIRGNEEATYGATKEEWKVDQPEPHASPTAAQVAATDAVIALAAAASGRTRHAGKGS